MPVYQFICEDCKKIIEMRLTFQQHSDTKNNVFCEKCGKQCPQMVAPLNFRLVGEGWFGRDGGNNASGIGYEVTQRELNKNKEVMDRAEDYANKMMARDEKLQQQG